MHKAIIISDETLKAYYQEKKTFSRHYIRNEKQTPSKKQKNELKSGNLIFFTFILNRAVNLFPQ